MPTNFNSDIYSLSEYVDSIKKKYTENIDEETLQLGIFGYLGEVQSNILQNSIVMASEFANESIPTKAKFEKNVIAHALGLGYNNINAVPAVFDVLLTFRRSELDLYMDNHYTNLFYLDSDQKFFIGDYEFHLDYDLRIKRIKHNNGIINYTATYVTEAMDNIAINGYRPHSNPVSKITNPYLPAPTIINLGGDEVVYIKCTLRQCTKKYIDTEILQDNTIVSRSTSFTFEDQLAGFDIDVTTGDETVHLIPVYEGLYTNTTDPYFYYTYLDNSTIRIKFTSESYQPRVNAQVKVNLTTTLGEEGNFEWKSDEYPFMTIASDKLFQEIDDNGQVIKTLQSSYSNIIVELRPITGKSQYGVNKKSIEELKRIIPRESIARGSITNVSDLENYFNSMDTESSRMYIYKRRDNCLERLYYGYILMKNSIGNIIPTNTIDMDIYPSELSGDSIKKLFRYNRRISYSNGVGRPYEEIIDNQGVPVPETTIDYLGNLYNSVLYPLENPDDYCEYVSMGVVTHHYDNLLYYNDEPILYHKATAILKDADTYEVSTIANFYKDWILEYIVEYAHKYFAFQTDDTATVRLGLKNGYKIPLGANIKSILYTQFREYLSYCGLNTDSTLSQAINTYINIKGESEPFYIPVIITGTHEEYTNYTLVIEFHLATSASEIPHSDNVNFTSSFLFANNSEVYLYQDSQLTNDATISSVVTISGPRTVVLNSNVTINEGDTISNTDEPSEQDSEKAVFDYISPYNVVINTDPLYVMYYLPYMNTSLDLNFDYVDETSEFQFIATYLTWKRLCLPETDVQGNIIADVNTYFCDIQMQINVTESGLIEVRNGNIDQDTLKIRVFMVLRKNDVYHRWIEGTINYYDQDTEMFNVHFEMSSQIIGTSRENNASIDHINDANEIRIYGLNRLEQADAADSRYGYGDFAINTDTDIYVCYYYDPESEEGYQKPYGYDTWSTEKKIAKRKEAEELGQINKMKSLDNPSVTLIKTLDKNTLYEPRVVEMQDEENTKKDYYLAIANKYSVSNGISFFYDFSNICNSTVRVQKVNDENNSDKMVYHIANVPVLRHGYYKSEERAQEFISEIISRKNYIDSALEVIEDSFGIDFKFVNTYGPCSMVTTDNKSKYLDRVNLTLKFRMKYNANYDTGVMDDIIDSIKNYIEDINSISSIHMPNLCNHIMDLYGESLEFFEFVNMNEYDSSIQHMYAKDQTEAIKTPEFVNVEIDENDLPCIDIEVVS